MRAEWNHESRVYREFNEAGVETLSRPYTVAENAAADAAILSLAATTNKGAVEANILQDMATYQSHLDKNNPTLTADFNANPAALLKDIYRGLRRLDRMALAKFDGAN